MGLFDNQQGFQQVSPLVAAVTEVSGNYIKGLIGNGQISQIEGNQIFTTLQQHMQRIVGHLTAKHQYEGTVPGESIQQTVAQYANEIITIMRTPQQTNLFNPVVNQPLAAPSFMNSNYMQANVMETPSLTQNTQTRPFTQLQPTPLQPITTVPQVIGPVKSILVRSTSQTHTYKLEKDNNATQLSTKCGENPMFDVKAKMVMKDEIGNVYNYCDVVSHVPEPSLENVIRVFKKMNPNLCMGKWISNIAYRRFILHDMCATQVKSEAIDTSSLYNDDKLNFPVDVVIQSVIDSIHQRYSHISKAIGDIIKMEFNDLSKRYLRLTSNEDMHVILKVESLDDIGTMASMRDRQFGEITYHKDYEKRVLACFITAIERVITEWTMLGYYNTMDIAENFQSCPNYIIRDGEFTERELLPNLDPKHAAIVENRYTAFAQDGSIVISNFIPEELEEDIGNNCLTVDQHINPLIPLLSGIWGAEAKTVVMTDGDKTLVVKNGVDLNGVPFIFRDTINLKYGLGDRI